MPLPERPAHAPPRIMMIDDELSNLQIVKIILTREHYSSDLLLYDNGREALEYLRGHAVDLILLDLAMPDMDGFEVMTRLQETPATAGIPVIFLSAYQETEYILRAFELGAMDFIGKPIISPILTARIRHIIEARGLQTALQQSNDELVNSNRLKDELLSICSHDLRAPLSAIELICQFLRDAEQGPGQHSRSELINRIVSQSRLARRLVENLLDLNRIEEGRLIPVPSFFPIAQLLRDCLEDELPTLQARKLEHCVDLPREELLCFGDREMIAQVVHNILNNASKFARSRIDIAAALEGPAPEQGATLRLDIADDGPGIPAEQQRAVFEKYAKLESQGSGSGLGLYISRQMIELHHGSVSVQALPAGGTRFQVRLPGVFRPEELPDLSPVQQRRVTVVSATRSTVQLLEGVLVEAGMIEVSQVHSPERLEQALHQSRPDLLVLDAHAEPLLERLVACVAGLSPRPPCILFGEREATTALAERLRGVGAPSVALAPPLNPLWYLREVLQRLHPPGNIDAQANV
jgi:signal transduction histidine kinase